MDGIMDFIMEKLLLPTIAVVCVAAVFIGLPLLGYSVWQQSKSPTFTLYKNQWACTESQTVPVVTYVLVNKVMVPITSYVTECHQWSRQP